MAIAIGDHTMVSDETPHTARPFPGEDYGWEVSWLPGRHLSRDYAITALVLAEVCSPAEAHRRDQMQPFIQGWADELGLTADEAVTQTAREPAWAASQEPAAWHVDPEAGE